MGGNWYIEKIATISIVNSIVIPGFLNGNCKLYQKYLKGFRGSIHTKVLLKLTQLVYMLPRYELSHGKNLFSSSYTNAEKLGALLIEF